MAPIFPNFKKLELHDKEYVERITKKYLPYSDFNFISLYTWNTDLGTHFSELHDNLVIQMKAYGTEKDLITFLGNNNIETTIDELLQYAKEKNIPSLELIPESNIRNHTGIYHKYHVEENRDQFDYIYNLSEMVNMEGRIYLKRRNMLRMFEKSYAETIMILDITKAKAQEEIVALCDDWTQKKKMENKQYDENELIAIKRCFTLAETENLFCLGVYIDNRLVGFSIIEILPNDYCIFHYEKTDHTFKGITEFIKVNIAKHLLSKGIKFMNAEQDLGIEGLRRTKLSYNPATFLKKFTISQK